MDSPKFSMERRDFWKLGPVWVWKWLVIGGIFTASMAVIGIFGLPTGHLSLGEGTVPTYRYDDPALQELSGEVRLTDETGRVRYWGEVDAGSFTGRGRVFDSGEQLVYDGPLVDGLREGADAKVYEKGVLVYEGEMTGDVYEGEGTVYDGRGRLVYRGELKYGEYHGQGKLFDPALGALLYQGEFEEGRASGTGQLYHPSGQLLYTGTVWDGMPRADAFLGLSLEEVEGAFAQHWLLYYASDGSAAFVYPTFGLMFWTEGPVALTSAKAADAQAEEERQELLSALSAPAPEGQEVYEVSEDAGEPAVLDVSAEPEDEPEPLLDMALDQNTDKSGLVIREVLSYQGPLAGTAQPSGDDPAQTGLSGWREWFCDFAQKGRESACPAAKVGPFVYEFPEKAGENTVVERRTAHQGGVETVTAYRDDKEGTWWYQSAVEKKP